VVDRIDEHHRPLQYIPRAKLVEALRAVARLRGERFHRDFVPSKAIRLGKPTDQDTVALTLVAANCGRRNFAAQRLRKINPELSFRHLETRNG
jgi:hypothetical protein